MKKRITVTTGPKFQAALGKLARKLSLETSTAWDSQAVLERLLNLGMTQSLTAYYPQDKVPNVRD